MINNKSIISIILAIVITAAVGGVYFWQKNQSSAQITNGQKTDTPEIVNTDSFPRFENIEKLVLSLGDPATALKFETSEPSGLVRVKNVTPEGTDFFESYVLAQNESVQTFYIENVYSQPESTKETHKWFGPFNVNNLDSKTI